MDNTNNIEDKKVRVEHLHYIFGVIATIMFSVSIIFAINPDTDAYFLIDNGKYILENSSVPTTNIWTIHKDFNIVIQQWICSVLNYIAYNVGEWYGIKALALIEYVIFNIFLNKYIREFTNQKKQIIITQCLMNIAYCVFFNTRPYQLTISAFLYEATILYKFYENKISNKHLWVSLCAVSLFIINYQSASWYFVFVFLLPYLTPWVLNKKWYKNIFNDKTSTIFMIIPYMLVLGLLNPNGVTGIKYLWNSYDNVNDGYISETLSPSFISMTGIVILIFIVLFLYYLLKCDKINKNIVYMSLGTLILSFMMIRNYWMLLLNFPCYITFVIKDLVKDDVHRKSFKSTKYIIICEYILGSILLIAILLGIVKSCVDRLQLYDRFEITNYLDEYNKDDIILYTDFNTGAYFEFKGYKTYIDARPELYQKVINGKEDIFTEFISVMKHEINIKDFLDKYKFTHLVVERPSTLDTYLYYSDDYTMIIEDDNCRLYERKGWLEK